MRTTRLSTVLFLFLFFANITSSYAQDAWYQGRKAGIYTVGFGGTQVLGIYSYGRGISTLGMNINVSGEYKVWDFIGVGWQTGIMIFPYRYSGATVGIPIGLKANVHILDAIETELAEKLDCYGGINIGGGPAFNSGGVWGFMHVGPQLGARYWFNKKVAIMGEFGWGATFANIGVTF